MRPTYLVTCAALLCAPLAAQQRHTITHEDIFLMKRVSSPVISPDGRAILFLSMVYPGATTDSANRAAAADRRARKYNARVYDASPIRLWDHWLDERRPSLFVQPLEPGSPARDLLAGSQLVANP